MFGNLGREQAGGVEEVHGGGEQWRLCDGNWREGSSLICLFL